MASIVQLKRSALSGKVPGTGSLDLGELAVNTYDGKIYFKKSGSIESVESVVTTNSVVTGSIRLEGTGSFGSLQVNDTLTVNHGVSVISGSLGITSDLTVLGSVNARQFNISVISSSVLFQSGSTKFGDTSDDTHSFTGSVSITGSFLVNGTEVGVATGPNTYDFNLDPEAAGTVNYIVDSTENTYALAQTGSFLVNGTEVGVATGPNTFDFNLDPEAAGTVNFIEDSTGNTQAVARTGSFDVKISNTTRLSVSSSAMWVTTGSITSNYMHLAKYITTSGDLDFNI